MITAPNDRLESFLGDFQEVPVILGVTTVRDKRHEPSNNQAYKCGCHMFCPLDGCGECSPDTYTPTCPSAG